MRQQTFAAQRGFREVRRKTSWDRFLEEMEQIVPWAELQALVELHYLKGEKGQPVIGLSIRRVQFKNFVDELQKAKNRVKARVRGKVEHPFRILKSIFGFEKVRYRGIQKNHHRQCASFALVNLHLHRRRLAVARA
jgi:hypothetical protein